MIYKIVPPSSIKTAIQLPASKSISNRALIINSLSNNKISVDNLSESDDTRLLLNAIQSESSTIDVGAAGTAMRFLTAYFAQKEGIRIITGSERMKKRPIGILVEALRKLGGEIEYLENEGFPPLRIKGRPLRGGIISLDGSVSSQFLSALMMIAPTTQQGLTLELRGEVVSKPYIEMTAKLMRFYGIDVIMKDNIILIREQKYEPRRYRVENDWSAASYWYEIASLYPGGVEIRVENLPKDSLQGDAVVSSIFRDIGVATRYKDNITFITKQFQLCPYNFVADFTDMPDLAQTMAVTACMLGATFKISGLQSLRIKETDRIAALITELRKLGYCLTAQSDNTLEWDGTICESDPNPIIDTYDDHRMAMAFAPVCIKEGEISIRHPQVVSKSYPGFWEDLKKAGFGITETKN